MGLIVVTGAARSGVGHVGGLLASTVGSVGDAAPVPSMGGHVLSAWTLGGPTATFARRSAWKMRPLLATLERFPTYVEASVTFPLTWADVVRVELPSTKVVVVRRDRAATIESLLSLGAFSEHNPAWSDWLHDPWHVRDHRRRTSPRPTSAAELVEGYVDDIGERLDELLHAWPGRTVEVAFESLVGAGDDLQGLCNTLDLEVGPETERNRTLVTGRREQRKRIIAARRAEQPTDVASATQPTDAAVDALANRDSSTADAAVPRRTRFVRVAHVVDLSDTAPGHRAAAGLASIRAMAAVGPVLGFEVELLAVGSADDAERCPDGVRFVPPSDTDAEHPALSDVLRAINSADAPEFVLFQGAGTSVRLDLHDVLAELVVDGADAIAVRGRQVRGEQADGVVGDRLVGAARADADIVAFDARLLDRIEPGDVRMGDPWGMRVLLWNLAQHADRLVERADLAVATRSDPPGVRLKGPGTSLDSPQVPAALAVLERLLVAAGSPTPRPQMRPYLEDIGLLH